MPIPRSSRVVYAHNPLAEVICQLKYPPILEIAVAPPAAFQTAVRERYQLYRRDDQLQAPPELREVLKQIPIQIQTQPVHRFTSDNETWSVALSTEFVAVTTNTYDRWERFYREVKRAQEALEDTYRPAFYSRVGLRYRDVIDRAAAGLGEAPWSELLRGSFLGLLGAPEVRPQVREVNTQVLIEIPDVPGGCAAIQHGIVKRGPEQDDAYLIDVDYYTQERMTGDGVEQVLRTFNEAAGNLFRWAITRRLSDALGEADLSSSADPAGNVA